MNARICQGSLLWPSVSCGGTVFWCKRCGHVFERDQLEGRDDHMPAHYPAGQSQESAEIGGEV